MGVIYAAVLPQFLRELPIYAQLFDELFFNNLTKNIYIFSLR